MFDWFRSRLLTLMRVPPAPEPPAGAPESVRVFRAGRNYYRLRLLRWGLAQIGAVAGLVFSLSLLYWFKAEVQASRLAPPPAAPTAAPAVVPTPAPRGEPTRNRARWRQKAQPGFIRLAQRTPDWGLLLIELFEFGGIVLFLVQLPVTAAAVRLEFELHWYIVTDRSLRIRTGLLRLQESTMSFANLQQVEVQQGPLQRLLGLSDLRVQSAGGGSGLAEGREGHDSLHTGIFHGVENAGEIRDLILLRLKKFRESGIGDPDEPPSGLDGAGPEAAATEPSGALAAAQELIAEARLLREAVQGRAS